MEAKAQAAYDTGYSEAINYGKLASFEDYAIYVGDSEDYEAYVDGFEYGLSLIGEHIK